MLVCITNIDSKTKILCTEASMRNGPSLPNIKGFVYKWSNESIFPINTDTAGVYLALPLLYGICDDDADKDVSGFIEELTQEEWDIRLQQEILDRKPYDSWVWNDESFVWVAPIERPQNAVINGGDTYYLWDDNVENWVAM
tara:strand:- start:905 stop:1327 length:423 start_codon:yes stop_codon:yes gene_type:complete